MATRPRRPVQDTADELRARIFENPPETRLGSLGGLAEELGVGIVTVQQAARILEHEGLLDVRRGPGGGYYGTRPDAAALERALAAFMQTEPASWTEALEMTSLLFNELCAAAAGCRDAALLGELEAMRRRIAAERDEVALLDLESAFQELLFRMVDRPLFALLTRVTLHLSAGRAAPAGLGELIGFDEWREGRERIIAALLGGDEELARFEANRSNRRILLERMRGMGVAVTGKA